MDALWTEINQGHLRATCLWLGFTELVWVLQRRRNTGILNPHAFATVYQQFRQDCEQVAWIGLSWGQSPRAGYLGVVSQAELYPSCRLTPLTYMPSSARLDSGRICPPSTISVCPVM